MQISEGIRPTLLLRPRRRAGIIIIQKRSSPQVILLRKMNIAFFIVGVREAEQLEAVIVNTKR
jgi:hypothetical protein